MNKNDIGNPHSNPTPTSEECKRILDLRMAGQTYAQIIAATGFGGRTIHAVLRKNKLALAVHNLNQMEEIFRQHGVDPKSQMEASARLIKRLQDELSTRSFQDLPAEKLIKMIAAGEKEYDRQAFRNKQKFLKVSGASTNRIHLN